MPYSLPGRNVLVTGSSRGLGALVATKFASEGCNVAINYASNREPALELANSLNTTYKIKTAVIQGDCTSPEDNANLIREAVTQLGGLDVIIANAGWTRFANWDDIDDLKLEEWNKCWAANVMSLLQLVQGAKLIFDGNPEGGCVVLTSSIAGTYTGGSSMGYSVSKAAGLHLMKCLAATQGPKIRINAVLPGLLLTDWGLKFGEERLKAYEERTVLKEHTNLEDVADMYVAIVKNKSMTGQEVLIDSGLKSSLR